jgi:hypothetical protein
MSEAPEAPKPTPPAEPADQKPEAEAPQQLPADHPLVKALSAQKDELKALKEKARRLDEIEEANKSEAQKVAERLAAAEKDAAEARATVLRRDVAIEFKLDKDDAALLDKITDEDAMRSLAARLKPSDEPHGARAPKPDPNQGRSGAGGPKSTADSFAEFFRNALPERYASAWLLLTSTGVRATSRTSCRRTSPRRSSPRC